MIQLDANLSAFDLKRAIKEAKEFGYGNGGTFALKLISPDAIHKSDMGLVRLNVRPKHFDLAFQGLISEAKKHNYRTEGILVQAMAERGLELFVGGKRDPQFGPVVVFGEGGLLVEYRKDLSMRICSVNGNDPIGLKMDIDEARRLVNDSKVVNVMAGIRGLPRRDAEAVAELILDVATLLCQHPEVKELDLNPVISHKNGYSIVDARVMVGSPLEGHELLREQGLGPVEKAQGLRRMMKPRSIAIIGASETNSVCRDVVERVKGSKFRKDGGELYLVSRKEEGKTAICGMEYYGSVSEIPRDVDLAVICVNKKIVPAIIRECGRKGVKGAIIISDGFKEAGFPELEDELVTASRESGVPYIGPNCVGVIDLHSGVDTIFVTRENFQVPETPGGMTMAAQSGAVGVSTLRTLVSSGMSFGKFFSVGNASCINLTDVLHYLKDDPETSVITLYAEGIPNGREFMEVAREVSMHKPICLFKGGKSDVASKAASSHTGSAIGSWDVWETALRQAGVINCETLAEFGAISTAFTRQLVSKGRRAGIVTNAGGFGVILADRLVANGLEMPDEATTGKKNPLDTLGNSKTSGFLKAVEGFLANPNFDCVFVAPVFGPSGFEAGEMAEGLLEFVKRSEKPIIVYTPAPWNETTKNFEARLMQNGVPVCTSEAVAAKVMRALWERGRFLERCNRK